MMGRLIDADALSAKMYHDAFETDSDMQRWDSGCWIRYKMFENAIDAAPTIEPERKRGKWIHGREVSREMIGDAVTAIFYEGWECSECHALVEGEREPLWKFCPNCSADMREDNIVWN